MSTVTEETTTKAFQTETSGYITKAANSIQDLVHLVSYDDYDHKVPGVYQLVIPAELVEDTIHELLPLLSSGDIIIDHGNKNFKDSRGRQSGWKNLVSNILTTVLLVEFMVWNVDIVLWLVVQILQYPSVLLSSGHSTAYLQLPHRSYESCPLVLSMVGYIVVVQGLDICKNGP